MIIILAQWALHYYLRSRYYVLTIYQKLGQCAGVSLFSALGQFLQAIYFCQFMETNQRPWWGFCKLQAAGDETKSLSATQTASFADASVLTWTPQRLECVPVQLPSVVDICNWWED